MDLVLDESIPGQIEAGLKEKGVETGRYEIGKPDNEVLGYAVKNNVPVLTRDQGDFVRLSQEVDHPGILLDKQMHLREDIELVTETIKSMLENIPEADLSNNVWYVSDYYGR